MIGYVIISVNDVEVPMAMCLNVPVHSMSDEAYTYHKVVAEEISSRVALIPVGHLFYGMEVLRIGKKRVCLITDRMELFNFEKRLLRIVWRILTCVCWSRSMLTSI